MCLCTQITNGINLVCCNCRYNRKGNRLFTGQIPLEKCPKCQNKLVDIGSKIEVPKKTDKKGWEKLQDLILKTEYFSVCQC